MSLGQKRDSWAKVLKPKLKKAKNHVAFLRDWCYAVCQCQTTSGARHKRAWQLYPQSWTRTPAQKQADDSARFRQVPTVLEFCLLGNHKNRQSINQSISRLGSRTLHRASQAPHQLQRFQKASVACSILQHLAAVSKTDAMMIHFTKEKMTKPSLTMIPWYHLWLAYYINDI
jgi:hypothetical protein